jgi:uncharacterized protein YbcV (DUF1398 family)
MFTLQQIKTAHAKVKTGADFPAYIQELKQLGLTGYSFMVTDGSAVYYGKDGYEVRREPGFAPQVIASPANAEALLHAISNHQQGGSDFPTICRQAAEAGVEKWAIDMQAMTCTYFDLAGNKMLAEPIPQGEYA